MSTKPVSLSVCYVLSLAVFKLGGTGSVFELQVCVTSAKVCGGGDDSSLCQSMRFLNRTIIVVGLVFLQIGMFCAVGSSEGKVLGQSDTVGGTSPLVRSAYARKTAEDPDAFTIAIIPDTQYYAASYPDILDSITKWIVENMDVHNIEFVLHVGDITDDNSLEQWQRAKKSMSILDGAIPYVLTLGNHDYLGRGNALSRHTFLNHVFPIKDYGNLPTFGEAFEEGKLDNAYYSFKVGNGSYLVLALEFGPRDEVLDWASEVISSYSDHSVIIVTHCYMYWDDTRVGIGDAHNPKDYPLALRPDETVNDGEDIWAKLVSKHENIFLVVSGHIPCSWISKRVDKGLYGNYVLQLLVDFQGLNRGGDGYIALLSVFPKDNRIFVEVYSPYLDEYMAGERVQWWVDLNSGVFGSWEEILF